MEYFLSVMPNDYLHSRVGRYATETVSIDDIV
nr:MAG TPA_asm: hypothetical protein [Caudoviricetes sp.]